MKKYKSLQVAMALWFCLPLSVSASEYPKTIAVYDVNNDVTATAAYQQSKQTFEEETYKNPEYSAYLIMAGLYGASFEEHQRLFPMSEAEFWGSIVDSYYSAELLTHPGVMVGEKIFSPEELANATSTVIKEMMEQIVNYQVISTIEEVEGARVTVELYPLSSATLGRQTGYAFYDYVGETGYMSEEEPFATVRNRFGQLIFMEENIAPLANESLQFELQLTKNNNGEFVIDKEPLADLFHASISEEYAFSDVSGRINSAERFFLKSNFEKSVK